MFDSFLCERQIEEIIPEEYEYMWVWSNREDAIAGKVEAQVRAL